MPPASAMLYMTDDIAFKRDFEWVDGSFPQVVRFVLGHAGLGCSEAARAHPSF